jgi:hypothetical protein
VGVAETERSQSRRLRITTDMKKVLALALALVVSAGCNKQEGYSHSPKQFTEQDRRAIARVQRMALGKPDLLTSIAAEYTDEESPEIGPCDYEVHKIIRRDLNKIQGEYLEEIHVICVTSTKESGLLQFVWVFDTGLERIKGFTFGFDPSEFDLDE